MSYHKHLRDEQWDRIKEGLPGSKEYIGRSSCDNRRFVEAVIWIGKNGGKWRSLPKEYGNWNSTHRRFRRWSKAGVWQMIFNELAMNADMEWVMIDSTIVRTDQHATGARKQQMKPKSQKQVKQLGVVSVA